MIEVRPVEARDEEAWRRLFTAYGAFYETDISASVATHVWTHLLDGRELHGVVAEHEGTVVGFGVYRSHVATFRAGRDWYLEDLFVDPSARGRGAATAIIQHVAGVARAVSPGTLRWVTNADNERAQRVYDRIATRTSWITYEVEL